MALQDFFYAFFCLWIYFNILIIYAHPSFMTEKERMRIITHCQRQGDNVFACMCVCSSFCSAGKIYHELVDRFY